MYLSYYNLKHKPFQISTDPGFLWLGEKHMEALSTLRYGVLDNKGFLLLTGDVGTGKTTLINALLKTLKGDVLVATIRDPDLKPLDFFQYTAHVFGLQKEITSKGSFLIHFEKFLNQAHERKKKVLLIIDEAQRINQRLLEEIRLLSNIEKNESKLLNIFFVGQIEFNDILLRPVNRPIRQRITINYNIEALSAEETKHYIKHRLSVASKGTSSESRDSARKSGPETAQARQKTSPPAIENALFTDGAIREIHLFSNGYPRLINIICDRCLLTCYVEESKIVLPRHVKECAKELEIPYFGPIKTRKNDSNSTQKISSTRSREKNRQAVLEQTDQTNAAIAQPITELAIPDGNSKTDGASHQKVKKAPPQKNGSESKRGKSTKRLVLGAAFSIVIILFSLSFFENSIPITRITNSIKTSSTMKNAVEIVSSILDDAGISERGSQIAGADNSDFAGKTMQENPPSQDKSEVVAAASSQSTPETNETVEASPPTVLGKLIMPFPSTATLPPPTSLANLNMLVESILSDQTYEVVITGYTDNLEDEKLNQELSLAKANAVKIYLISRGLEESKVETRARGSESPIAPNTTASGRDANHRVEVEFRQPAGSSP